jgi:phytanoyl-CoA hydroxylase
MMAGASVDKATYLKSGYAVLKSVLNPDALASINGEINSLFVGQLKGLGLNHDPADTREAFLSNAKTLLNTDVKRYIAACRITQDLPSVHRLLLSDGVLQIAYDLGIDFPVISTKASVHIMSDDLKGPNGYHKTPPHQDWRSIQGSLDNLVYWIPTTPVKLNSHALEVIPGSHLHGLLDTQDHIMTMAVNDRRIAADDYVAIEVDPGDVIVFSSFLVHRTGEAGDGLARIALSGRLNNAAEATYVNRGYPTPYSYSYRRDLMFDGFPTDQDLSTVFPAAAQR